ncbi:DNA-methyltransferase [Paenibacillus soyae]|uniref:Methyltransferase n=1 Tax=Paenibacillus soyae TaxID=2969249 RepID=A0A9X2SBX1_9BACL|nr:site-specific DNA-methyltransferase [Paenibacillus soyae]MCR2805402.1 site-specific DNA-methyltransferase [Paenibacillus soyae]
MGKILGSLQTNRIYQIDCIQGMKLLPDNSVDFNVSDPPYNIGRLGAKVNLKNGYKAIDEPWDNIENFHGFTEKWLVECYRTLKPDGSILVYGTHHSIFLTGYLMKEIGFRIKMQYVWRKLNPPPSFLGTNPTYATEFIIWGHKTNKYKYNLDYAKHINGGKNISNVFESSLTPPREKKHGKFPCQKPLEMTTKLIKLHSNEGDTILVPFCGSGTECVAATLTNRSFVTFETNRDYIEQANNRLDDIDGNQALIDTNIL